MIGWTWARLGLGLAGLGQAGRLLARTAGGRERGRCLHETQKRIVPAEACWQLYRSLHISFFYGFVCPKPLFYVCVLVLHRFQLDCVCFMHILYTYFGYLIGQTVGVSLGCAANEIRLWTYYYCMCGDCKSYFIISHIFS